MEEEDFRSAEIEAVPAMKAVLWAWTKVWWQLTGRMDR